MSGSQQPQDQEWVPERDEPPAVFDPLRVALMEIDSIVGNDDSLGSDECARIRAILHGALSLAPPRQE